MRLQQLKNIVYEQYLLFSIINRRKVFFTLWIKHKLTIFSTLMQLALKAGQLLEQTKLSELRTNIARSLSELEMFTEEGERTYTPGRKSAIDERMEDLVNAPLAVEDALVALFDHSDHTLQRRVVETYVRRLYQVRIRCYVPLW